ncbi:MAG TPA: outer membrane protein assembly factor BamD [Desulfuromonadaceae bacterium]
MHYRFRTLSRTITAGLMLLFLATLPCAAAELDDSNLFVEAFNAYQKRDYLLAIDKVNRLTQAFPDSPLRDLSLLLLARAGLKSGDNELAARAINQFSAEYTDNSLKSTVEEELLALGARRKKGEKLPPNRHLQLAAQKVRNDQVALERAAALKAEQERLAREKAERERIAAAKAEAERKERERIAAEKAAKAAIKLAIAILGDSQRLEVGQKGHIPFEMTNTGTGSEEFLVSVSAPREYAVALTSASRPEELVERVTLAAGETLKGTITARIPFDKVDGSRAHFHVTAVSAKYGDVAFAKEAAITASAPLVRAVAKPHKAKVAPGEPFSYRVTVLNAGSIAARDLTLRSVLPPQVEFIDAAGADFRREADGSVVFSLPGLETGRLAEFNLNVKVRDAAREKEELRMQVEVANNHLHLKDAFTSSAAVVQGK